MTASPGQASKPPGVSTDDLRSVALCALADHAMAYDVMIISHGPQSAIPHHRGVGHRCLGSSRSSWTCSPAIREPVVGPT